MFIALSLHTLVLNLTFREEFSLNFMELIPPALGIVFAVLLHLLSRRLPMWAYIFISLPGTLLHELSHWVFAFILRAKPSWPSIIPKREGKTWCLGSVSFRAKWHSACIVALAPLIVLLASSIFLLAPPFFNSLSSSTQFKLIAVLLWFGPALLPSKADWMIAFEFPVPLLFLLTASAIFVF